MSETNYQSNEEQSAEEEAPIKVEEFLLVEDIAYVKMEDPCILAFWRQTAEAMENTKPDSEDLELNSGPDVWDMHWKDYRNCRKGEQLQNNLHGRTGELDIRPCYTWQITKWLVSEKPVDGCQAGSADNTSSPESAISKWYGWSKDEQSHWPREITDSIKFLENRVPDTHCHHCSEDFSEKDDLLRHINEEHLEEDVGYFQCSKCFTSFDSKNNIINHLQNINNMCRLCSEYFCSASGLQTHYQDHKRMYRYTCDHCKSRFHNEVQYQQHALLHEGYKIDDSSLHKRKHNRSYKKSTKKRRSIKRPYECVLCPKTYAYKHSLEVHIQKHNQEKILKCNFCPSTFYSKHSFIDHMTMTHPARNSSLTEKFSIVSSYGAQSKKDLGSDVST
ncbi:zinc finger protein 33B-like [Schistocerca nitens]|uniref:zinc finger protein 33B-like n=1 Tax=Schistocerca nitens TaxID=7011 RepID=UPI0021188160|nr:zinc finger protein 33B-like [Schistocerca nitens]XP_049801986.1 zinc finger protein 33B-like [Schistocerca nitens]XP_049801987.1 zinc finger protein 33B-like [Schistocerca nitens]XP_049801988.1 zinc finger protein 33B-like [Schistocerca nitens]XP_049801989.1 zinc finger protein 33B-like [Schistocerca nitens]XP_049801990.1 zinc finger protein 33B-like [Schistocerca nitens]XP_049801991.1 zinc finger protein 33B-like [Schistocerca nitens]XP_049801992.1 zinc finger protein 33B-like [Schistoc